MYSGFKSLFRLIFKRFVTVVKHYCLRIGHAVFVIYLAADIEHFICFKIVKIECYRSVPIYIVSGERSAVRNPLNIACVAHIELERMTVGLEISDLRKGKVAAV